MMLHWLKWTAISVAALMAVVLATAFFADEPLRRYVEQSSNEAVGGYRVHIGTLDLHPLTFSAELSNVVVRHKAHPDPPLVEIPRIEIDARIAPLLRGNVAADIFLNDPIIAVSQELMAAVLPQSTEESPQTAVAWQDQIRNMISFEATLFLKNGQVTHEAGSSNCA
jgi:uncharacterized protein involved in outer membrane biogenesis